MQTSVLCEGGATHGVYMFPRTPTSVNYTRRLTRNTQHVSVIIFNVLAMARRRKKSLQMVERVRLNHHCNCINNVVLDEARLCFVLTNSKTRHLRGLNLSEAYLNLVEVHLSEARSRYTRSPFARSSMESNTMFDTLFFHLSVTLVLRYYISLRSVGPLNL